MKLITDVDEEEYYRIACGFVGQEEDALMLKKIFSNGILISDNATNGDVIHALFPNAQICGVVGNVDKSWWNAPYKAESEE